MAGEDGLAEHPLYAESVIPPVTASGVRASTIAEYAITMLLALAHRVPRSAPTSSPRTFGGTPLLNVVHRTRGY
jgi:phosphoglycerate dehydrogenase-like enzyme